MRSIPILVLLTLTGVGLAQSPQQRAGAAQDQNYVGSETCQVCHEELHKAFQKNPHQRLELDKKRGWATKACEACHGPGIKHVDSQSAKDIVNPSKAPAAQVNQICLKCHLNEPTHVGRIQGAHARSAIACTACHSMHKAPEALVRRKVVATNQLCRECHTAEWSEFQRPYKHRLPEGAMSCVDCHNPHGTLLAKSVQTTLANEQVCLKCHGDLRGPFVFEHAPVRLSGCATCHEPHGSANPRMLRRHEQRFLCLECHANIGTARTLGGVPPGFHDVKSARFQNCTICHTQIHGSYVDRTLLQ